MKCATPAQ
uniref:Uncharacterized protein n=1 Tax=Anguilla anguilla TaxID=7936 RepID=A0A0E9TXD4_ANGAN